MPKRKRHRPEIKAKVALEAQNDAIHKCAPPGQGSAGATSSLAYTKYCPNSGE